MTEMSQMYKDGLSMSLFEVRAHIVSSDVIDSKLPPCLAI